MSAENPRGKGSADDGSAADDKDLSCPACGCDYSSRSGLRYHMKSCCPAELAECPKCDDRFFNYRGVKIHASRTHGLDLSSTTSVCPVCDQQFEHRSYADRKYCSRKCSESAIAKKHAENRIDVECIYCGDVVSLAPCFAEGRKYCSESCRSKDLTEKGVMNPNPEKEHVTFNCEYCGDEYKVVPAESDNTRFCSKRCQGKWRTGERNPNWRGGRVDDYGPNWGAQRLKALERDNYECQYCGVNSDDLERSLSVHHIQPLRVFKKRFNRPEWYEKGNRVDNLVSLCRSCHNKWEGIPLRPH